MCLNLFVDLFFSFFSLLYHTISYSSVPNKMQNVSWDISKYSKKFLGHFTLYFSQYMYALVYISNKYIFSPLYMFTSNHYQFHYYLNGACHCKDIMYHSLSFILYRVFCSVESKLNDCLIYLNSILNLFLVFRAGNVR
jgi:hypothetical protein